MEDSCHVLFYIIIREDNPPCLVIPAKGDPVISFG